MLKAILYLVKDYLPKVGNDGTIDPIEDIQILSPMHKGSGGIQNLNDALQNCLNNSAKAKRRLTKKKTTKVRNKFTLKKNTKATPL